MVVKDSSGTNAFVDCHCGCDSGLRIRVDREDDGDLYVVVNYTSADFYKDQATWFSMLKLKLQKIWAIIRNKDFHYSEVCMTKEEYQDFKKIINEVE